MIICVVVLKDCIATNLDVGFSVCVLLDRPMLAQKSVSTHRCVRMVSLPLHQRCFMLFVQNCDLRLPDTTTAAPTIQQLLARPLIAIGNNLIGKYVPLCAHKLLIKLALIGYNLAAVVITAH